VSKGIPEYNCCINSHKTIKNFQVLPDGSAQVDTTASHWFPWCGLLINTQTLEVANDYTRLCSQDISDTLTVVRSQHPLYSLQRHLRKYVGMRAHSIYVDAEMNSHQHILRHCYTTMMIVAMKFHSSVKAFRMGTRIHSHSLQLYGVILELVRHFYYTARRRHVSSRCLH
jgi:telomerase reverse transcriptase